jgi:serine-type D-Ala-D-Ala carboxypeptidase/endopeptidase (penicillin-binding protein 4)
VKTPFVTDARRRAFIVVLALASAVCLGVGLYAPSDAKAAGRGRSLATPVWSPRRAPEPIVDLVSATRLQTQLDAQVAGTDACVMVNGGAGAVASRIPGRPLAPASTVKLLTATAALATLGADFKYETRAVASAPPAGGTVDRLWLVGAGDPVLSTPDYEAFMQSGPGTRGDATTSMAALADAIVARGVRRVTGGVQGSDTRYEELRYLPVWKPNYRTDGEVGPLGALTVNAGLTEWRGTKTPADDPAVYAAAELTRLLIERGVAVDGLPGHSDPPPDATNVASVTSPPLADIIGAMLRSSQNLTAELLVREVGARASNQGTTTAGTQAVAARLAALGLPTEGLVMLDGSGLARDDRATCALLLGALHLGARPAFAALWTGLPVAGESGTLAPSFVGTPLQGKLRAKTGSLDGVTGLVGLLDLKTHLEFSLLANGPFPEVAGIGLRQQVALTISGYPDGPPAQALVPIPAPSRS